MSTLFATTSKNLTHSKQENTCSMNEVLELTILDAVHLLRPPGNLHNKFEEFEDTYHLSYEHHLFFTLRSCKGSCTSALAQSEAPGL